MLMVDVVRSGGGLTWEEPKCEIQCPGLGKKTCFFVLSFFDSRRYDAFLVFFSRRLRVCRLPRLPRFLVFLVFVLIFGVFVFVVSVLLHRSGFWGSQVLSGPWAKHDNAWQSTTKIQHFWLTLSHSRAHLLDTRTKMELGNVVISAFERSL